MTALRERILKAAKQQFRHAGGRGLRVHDICESAGVSRTSFYREFRNTDDVVAALAVRRWSQALGEALAHAKMRDSAAERWSSFIFDMARRTAAEPEQFAAGDGMIHVIGLMYRDDGAHLREIIDVIRPCIEASQREGTIRTDVSIEDIADWLLRQIWSLASVPFPSQPGAEDADAQLHRHIQHFILPGLLRPQHDAVLPQQVLAEIDKLGQALRRIEERFRDSR